MISKYNDGIIPNIIKEKEEENDKINISKETESLNKYIEEEVKNIQKLYSSVHVKEAIENIFEIIDKTNKYIDIKEPWAMYKRKIEDNENILELDEVLYTLAEVLRKVSILIRPIMPNASLKIAEDLNIQDRYNIDDWKDILNSKIDISNAKVNTSAENLFKRMDIDK